MRVECNGTAKPGVAAGKRNVDRRESNRGKAPTALRGDPHADAAEHTNIINLEAHRMYRLPQADSTGSLLERAAFLALNAVALGLVAIALLDGARFAAGRDEIAHALSAGISPVVTDDASVVQRQPPIGLKSTQQTAGAPKLHEPKS